MSERVAGRAGADRADSADLSWEPPQRPAWLDALNREGGALDLAQVVPLDEASLLAAARERTGLADFGPDTWLEPFRVLLRALEDEAQLTLWGRLLTRSDLLIWLSNRLQIHDLLALHPEIHDERIEAPTFIVGLPRSGTSILFELLACDPECGVPQTWEALFPCPAPETAHYADDPRIERAHALVTQWTRAVPEFGTMHEMGGTIPAECGLIWANTFVSDHIASLQQAPSYAAWYATADMRPVYEFHRTFLKILQWRHPRRRWLLKAPEHQSHLATLLAVYPDAQLVQTHRDPVRCMASTTSLLGALYWIRSDQPFDSTAFEDIVFGEATAARLEHVMNQRDDGTVPAENICDARYADLMDDPMACIERIYDHFGRTLGDAARQRMTAYLAAKPKGKFGEHRYTLSAERVANDRAHFRRYQERYRVADEV
ncbi:MAG: sulfotransferase [Deltaproteobacteria bacterium]|nr:sulfotransferase [Deltaproteobacteria bacterium]